MKTIYIDYTSSIPTNRHQYHGGGNYTKQFLLSLMECNLQNIQFVLLWPKGYSPKTTAEEKIYFSGFLKIVHVNNIIEMVFLPNSIMFLPLLFKPNDYLAIYKIKQIYSDLKIYATIHDIRTSYNKWDPLSHYYFKGYKYYLYWMHKPGRWFVNTFISSPKIKKGISILDKIFTDSNYSLQIISQYKHNATIITHYLTPLEEHFIEVPIDKDIVLNRNYFLFVSGNRQEKNLIRTLEAFCNFKKTDKREYYFYVTGVDEELIHSRFARYKKLDMQIIAKWCRPLGYVAQSTLNQLYKNATVFVYTSKYEGFGLPLLEAGKYGIPSLASWATSIPEVLGSAAYYIDPFDKESIRRGMEYITNPSELMKYKKRIYSFYKVAQNLMLLDQSNIIDEVTH